MNFDFITKSILSNKELEPISVETIKNQSIKANLKTKIMLKLINDILHNSSLHWMPIIRQINEIILIDIFIFKIFKLIKELYLSSLYILLKIAYL